MPILNVASPVSDRSLISLSALKTALEIASSTDNALLTQWIKDDSDTICTACNVAPDQAGRRTFLSESVIISYRTSEIVPDTRRWTGYADRYASQVRPLILPWRLPLTVSTVTVDDTTLTVATDIEIEPMAALLWRLDSNGERTHWERGRLVITGTAGWALVDVPAALRYAVVEMIGLRLDGRGRNSFLKVDQAEGVGRQEFWVGDAPGSIASIPQSVLERLQIAGLVSVAIG